MQIEGTKRETQYPRSKLAKTTTPEIQRLNTASPSEPKSQARDNALEGSLKTLEDYPWNPNVWQLRRRVVDQLKVDLQGELDLVGQLLEVNPENSLMWQHRRWIALKLGTKAASNEFKFTNKILCRDANNYLAWNHRKWIVESFDRNWGAELKYCDKMFAKDMYNEFVWLQRHFVITKCPPGRLEKDMMWEEPDGRRFWETYYALQAISVQHDNEIPWRYIRRLYKDEMQQLATNFDLKKTLVSIFESEKDRLNAVRVDDVVHEKHQHAKLHHLINKTGCQLALELVLDLLSHGFSPGRDLQDAINVLLPSAAASVLAFDERVRLILRSLGDSTSSHASGLAFDERARLLFAVFG